MIDIKIGFCHDKDGWYLQDLDIEHFAQGQTKEEALQAYKETFISTIQKHIERHGNLDRLFNFIEVSWPGNYIPEQ